MSRLFVSPIFEIALLLVRLDHVASFIVNADYGIVRVSDEDLYEN
jgi:hypothetical protein